MKRKFIKPLLAIAASAALASGLGMTVAASSAVADVPDVPAVDIGSLPDAAVAAMKRDLKLGSDKAVQARLDLDATAATIEKKAVGSLGRDYAGTWVSADGKSVVVGVSSRSAAKKARATGATVEIVGQSLDELGAVKSTLDEQSDEAGKNVTGWHVDPVTNSVVVSATTTAAAEAFIAAAGIDPDNATTEIAAGRAVPAADIRGGEEYRHIISQSGGMISFGQCSIGFAVQGGGFVSAGHCGTTGQDVTDVNFNALGTYQGSTFPGNDYSWVKTNSNWESVAQVTNYSGGWVSVMGSQEAAIGASVCRSGRTTHWQCGVIEAKNVTINYAVGPVTGAVRMTACAAGGDSGGSVISGNQAQGVMSGISGACGDPGFRSFYQPVNPILSQYNLKLAVGTAIQGFSNKCIDVNGANFVNSVQVQLWNCNGTQAQGWDFRSDGTIRVGGLCLDVRSSGTTDGTPVQIYTCNGTQAQQFVLSGAGDLVSVLANKCVDVTGNNANNGTKLQIWTCAGTANQKWWKH